MSDGPFGSSGNRCPRVYRLRLRLARRDPIPSLASYLRIEERQLEAGREHAGRAWQVYDFRITTRRILYGLAAMIAVLIVGTIIGLIWADTSNLAGGLAVVTNIVGVIGIVLLAMALVLTRHRRQS